MGEIDRFCWFELVTTDPADARAFWEQIGFRTWDTDLGGETYARMARGTADIGGIAGGSGPSHWVSYLGVADLEAALRAVTANGGRVLGEIVDIGIGRFAPIADPEGARFHLWQGNAGGAPGVHWNELWAKDADRAVPFYRATFGFADRVTEMPQGAYHVLAAGETMVAGVMTAPDPKVPPAWLPYLEVDDTDAAVERVRRNGGQVHAEPMEVPGVGRFAIVADRQGAVVGLIRPA